MSKLKKINKTAADLQKIAACGDKCKKKKNLRCWNFIWNDALFFRVRQNTVFSSFAILVFDRTGGSSIFGGATAGVVRTSTGGSPSSRFPIFSREKGANLPRQEPRRSRSTLVTLVCLLHVLHGGLTGASTFASPKENHLSVGGGGLRWGFLIWLAGFVRVALFGSTFHTSCVSPS